MNSPASPNSKLQTSNAKLPADSILIRDLEVAYRVGVPDAERKSPQRLLISAEIFSDFTAAISADAIQKTVDYFAVCQKLLRFGENREWKLIEKLADDLARMILADFAADRVSIEVKKFVIPQAAHVSARVTRTREWLKAQHG